MSPTTNREAIDYALWMAKQGYLTISKNGQIWRTHANIGNGWQPLKSSRRAENVSGNGYLRVTLQLPNGKLGSTQAHRLIWEYFKSPIPENMQINHKDLNRQNNALSNLEVVDASGNIKHSYANGRPNPWYKATVWRGKERITPELKQKIKNAKASGKSYTQLVHEFGISKTHVARICKG